MQELKMHDDSLYGPCFSNDIFEITNDVENSYRIRRYLLVTGI